METHGKKYCIKQWGERVEYVLKLLFASLSVLKPCARVLSDLKMWI